MATYVSITLKNQYHNKYSRITFGAKEQIIHFKSNSKMAKQNIRGDASPPTGEQQGDILPVMDKKKLSVRAVNP